MALQRQARDRLSESEFRVGRHYYRTRWYPGAITRLEALLETDPEYTGRDGAYFFLAEAYARMNRTADARTYYQKLLEEFAVSEYLDDARKRLRYLPETPPAAAPATADTPAPTAPSSGTASTPASPSPDGAAANRPPAAS